MNPARDRLVLAATAGLLSVGSGVALLATSAWLISRAAEQPPVLTLMVAIVAVRAFGLGRGVLRYAERLVAHDAAFRVQADLRVRVYARLERLAPDGLRAFRSGDLLTRTVSDVDAVLDRILRVVLPFTIAGLAGAGTAALLAIVLPIVGAVAAIAIGLVLLGIPLLVARTGRAAERAIAPERGALATEIGELLDAAPELLAYGAAERALADTAAVDARLRRAEARASWSTGLGNALVVLLVGAVCLAGARFGVIAVRSGELDTVLLAVVALTPLALADVLAGVPLAAASADRSRPARARVGALLVAPEPVHDPAHPRPLPAPPYRLQVSGVAVDGRLPPTDFTLDPGDRVVVTGPSGSGKSTLAHTLVRFVEPDHGRITVNGVDVRELAADDVRRVIRLCEQDAYVFDSTIADNVRLARPDATDADVRTALDRARLPLDLDTRVGEHGDQLSGGERRRLALARCLLTDAPVLVFDEPTEHVDDVTADELLADLLSAAPERGVLLITHRPISALPADLVLKVGR